LSRGLEVLRVLNLNDGATLNTIARTTKLSRGSVHRLLETMVTEGYVRKTEGHYFVELKARALTSSLDVDAWINDTAQDAIDQLCRKAMWPISILRPNRLSMETCAGTERLSPLRYSLLPIGTRVAMMASASGQAYNAFHSESFQRQMISLLAKEAEFPEDRAMCQDAERVADVLRTVRKRGAAAAPGKKFKTSILSVPIMRERDDVLGALSMRFFASSLDIDEAMRRHLRAMQDTAATIAAHSSVQ
jgi:IclR family mhp operon transcriptional activator